MPLPQPRTSAPRRWTRSKRGRGAPPLAAACTRATRSPTTRPTTRRVRDRARLTAFSGRAARFCRRLSAAGDEREGEAAGDDQAGRDREERAQAQVLTALWIQHGFTAVVGLAFAADAAEDANAERAGDEQVGRDGYRQRHQPTELAGYAQLGRQERPAQR